MEYPNAHEKKAYQTMQQITHFCSNRYQSSQPGGTLRPSQMKRDFQQQYPQFRPHSNPPQSLNPRNEPSISNTSEKKRIPSVPRREQIPLQPRNPLQGHGKHVENYHAKMT